MFVVSEADAAAIRTASEQRGEFAAAVELRRLFPGITDNAQAGPLARMAVTGEAPEVVCTPPARKETIRPDRACGSRGIVHSIQRSRTWSARHHDMT